MFSTSLSPAKKCLLSSIMMALLTVTGGVSARDEFNLSILELDSPLENTSTLEAFMKNNALMPGTYLSTIKWGQDILDKREINYHLSDDKKSLIPEFTKLDLRELGVKVDSISGLKSLDDAASIANITDYINDAQYDFSLDTQTLTLRIPQIYRHSGATGDIASKNWDEGVPAAWVSYSASGSRQYSESVATDSNWLGVNPAINLGPWRVRNSSTWSDSGGWDSISMVVQRDIKALRSQLELGQTYTNGELFDSVQMTGFRLETDTSMLPNSLQGFAPVVRGIANSDAKITIKQNGYTLYQTYVSAGPFEIHDLSQVTAGSDLEVTVEEADGSEHSFIQASASVPILQREGALKYSIAGGEYRDNSGGESPGFGQGTVIYGLPHGITLFGGVLGASIYRAGLIGFGADLGGFGSFSVDMTRARTALEDGRGDAKGSSWRAQYSKDISATDTTVTLASYRYSTSGFYTFQEAVDQSSHDIDDDMYSYRLTNNRRSRLQMNLSQSVGGWGSVYANAYQQDYWNLSGHERSVSMGYSTSWRDITWSVNYSLTKTPDATSDRQIAFSMNIPLSRWLPNAWATYNMNRTQQGNTSHQVGIGGTALEDNNLSYNLQQSTTDNGVGYGASLSGRYRASYGEFGLGYNYSGSNRQWNYNAQGAVVAHPYGVTLGQSAQDAFSIVHIDNGAGVKVQNGQSIYTDAWGNAIVPNLTQYRRNAITVNTASREDLDIADAVQEVVPTKGAVVAANFSARQGVRALLTLRYKNRAVPFGAVLSMDGATAIVGDGGEVYVTGLKGTMPFQVQWGNAADNQCAGSVTIPEQEGTGVVKMALKCSSFRR